MITISTGGIGPMDIMANTKAKGSSKEEEKAVDAFASLMNMVSTRQDMTEMDNSQGVDVTEVTPSKTQSKDYNAYAKQEQLDDSKSKIDELDSQVSDADTRATEPNAVDEKTSNGNDTVDRAVALIKEVKTTLKKSLGLTDEEFDNILADMGIDLSQLLIGDNLKNFILQSQGANNVDLLVNEGLAELLSVVSDKISQLIENFDFTQNNSFQEFLQDNMENIQSVIQYMDENVDIIIDDVDNVDVLNQNDDMVDFDVDQHADDNQLKGVKGIDDLNNSEFGDDGIADKITVKPTTGDNQAMSQDQTADQSNQQIHLNFNQAIDNAVNANVDAAAFSDNVQEADIIRQIIDQIKVTAGKEINSMEVQLNPENLGKVYVNVEAKDGVMQARIIAETEAAKNAIENNLAVLKENFSNNEIKVEAIEVMVAAYGFFEESQNEGFDNQEQANDTSKSIGAINVNDLNEEELTQEEELEVEIMKTKGNTVSYTV